MNGHKSRNEWLRAFVTRLVQQELADIALTAGVEYASAAKTLKGYGLPQHVGFAATDSYANQRELQDIMDWKDRRKS